MDRAQLLAAGDRNLAGTLRHFAEHAPGASVEEDGGVLLVSSSRQWPGPYHNGVVRLDPQVAPRHVLERARAFFAERCPGYCVWIAAHVDTDLEQAALEAGYAAISDVGTPRMALLHRVGPGTPPAGVTLHEVDDEDGRAAFAEVTVAAYAETSLPPDAVEVHLGALGALRAENVRAVVARRHGSPAAAALALAGSGVAGIQMVGTVPGARHGGLGELCTRWAAEAGFDFGAAAVVLEASEQGEPLYRRLGFEELSRYRWCLGPPG